MITESKKEGRIMLRPYKINTAGCPVGAQHAVPCLVLLFGAGNKFVGATGGRPIYEAP